MNEFLDSDDEFCESDCENNDAEPENQHSDEDDGNEVVATPAKKASDKTDSQFDPNWVSKDGTKWFKAPPQRNVGGRAPKHFVIKGKTGITSYATSRISDEVSAFKLSFGEYVISEMLVHTNEKGLEKHGDNWKPLDATELDAFLGLLILAAVFKSNKESLETLWHEEMGRPIFRATMPVKRFRLIYAMLRFDHKPTRSPTKGSGISNVWYPWVERQSLLYMPHDSITIDEQLYGYRGRVFCKVFMRGKPDKYGMKFEHANCSNTGFVLRSQLYLGKTGDARQTSAGETTVCNLVVNRGYEGRNVTVDNYYTSLPLARTLRNNGMTLVGTLRANRRCIPPALLSVNDRTVGSSIYAYTGSETIVSYTRQKGKNVLLLSTMHTELQKQTPKPEIIQFYNSTKGAVDTLDRRIASYSVKRATRNWMVVVASDMMDITLNNSYILIAEVFKDKYSTANSGKRKFLQELGSKLVNAHIVRRSTLPRGEHAALVVKNRKRKSNDPAEEFAPSPVSKDRKRCAFCRGSDNKYSVKCCKCEKTICPGHTVATCVQCDNE